MAEEENTAPEPTEDQTGQIKAVEDAALSDATKTPVRDVPRSDVSTNIKFIDILYLPTNHTNLHEFIALRNNGDLYGRTNFH